MKSLIFGAAMIASTPALALEVGDRIALPGPVGPIACSYLEDTRQGVFHAARYGRQFNTQFVSQVNELHEEGRLCDIIFTQADLPDLQYRVVEKNKTGGGTYFAYFCLIEPNWDSCLWVYLPENSLSIRGKN